MHAAVHPFRPTTWVFKHFDSSCVEKERGTERRKERVGERRKMGRGVANETERDMGSNGRESIFDKERDRETNRQKDRESWFSVPSLLKVKGKSPLRPYFWPCRKYRAPLK